MAYTVPHSWIAGDFLRASWLQITTTDLIDHESRVAVLEAAKVTGQSSSVDSEIALFSSTSGKALKRASTTGMLKATSGVLAAATAGVDYPAMTSVTLTDAQIKALPTTAITLVSAPGSGKMVVPVTAMLSLTSSAGAYTNINADAILFLAHNGSESNGLSSTYLGNDSGLTITEFSDMFGVASTRVAALPCPYGYPWSTFGLLTSSRSATNVLNQPLQLTVSNNGSGNFTGGNAANTLVVHVAYLILG